MAKGARFVEYEPDVKILTPETDDYAINLMRTMTWYSTEKTKTDARKYMREYVKSTMPSELKIFDQVKDVNIVNSYGWISRIIMRDGQISNNHLIKFTSYLKNTLNNIDASIPPIVVKNTSSAPRISIQDAMKEKISEYIGELEGSFDTMIKDKTDFSLYKNLQANTIPKPYVPDVKEWVKKKLREFIEVYEGKDTQIVEAYSNYTKKELKSLVKTLAQFIEECDKYTEFKKANRKIRIIKPKAPGIQVKALKFKKEDIDLGLKSVSPTEIIGALQVWFYNCKTRKLITYKTGDGPGIQVKGTCLQNYEPDMSSQKTLRKPAEQIKNLMASNKVQLRKFMDTIPTKEQSVNGRTAAEMIILKVIK